MSRIAVGFFIFIFFNYKFYEQKIFITKKKKKLQAEKTQQQERKLYSRKKISHYLYNITKIRGQFVTSKEPTNLLRRDHLTRVWAAIFAFLWTQQTVRLGFGSEEGFYYIIYDEWTLLYHKFVGPLDINYLINHILG